MKTKKKKKPLSWEKDFDLWAKNATVEDVEEFFAPIKEGKEINFVNQGWGHSCTREKHGEMVCKLYGFSNWFTAGGKIKVGDFLFMKRNDETIGKWRIAKIDYKRDPSDAFDAYAVAVSMDDN